MKKALSVVAPDKLPSRGRKRSKRLVHDNGKKGRRTPVQLERQEKLYQRHVGETLSVRRLAKEFGVCKETVEADIRHESARRADEIAKRRETELARAVSHFEFVSAEAYRSHLRLMKVLEERPTARISDRYLEVMVECRAKIDLLLGLTTPTKVEVGLDILLQALKPE